MRSAGTCRAPTLPTTRSPRSPSITGSGTSASSPNLDMRLLHPAVACLADDNSGVGNEQQYEVFDDDNLLRGLLFRSRTDSTTSSDVEAALDIARSRGVPGEGAN